MTAACQRPVVVSTCPSLFLPPGQVTVLFANRCISTSNAHLSIDGPILCPDTVTNKRRSKIRPFVLLYQTFCFPVWKNNPSSYVVR